MSNNFEVLAIIPARGGSKGITRKNVMPVGGIPLVGRAIMAARQAGLVTRVMVSTDDVEIAEVSRRFGAEVMDRPAEISGDTASSESALLQCLDRLEANEGYVPDVVAFLQCTAPFLSPEDIDGTVDLVRRGKDAAFAAFPFKHFLWNMTPEGSAAGINHDGGPRKRRQDLKDRQWLEAGSVYAMRTEAFRLAGTRFCGAVDIWEASPRSAVEIDDPLDLVIAQAVATSEAREVLDEALPTRIGAVVFDFDGVFTDDKVLVDENGKETARCSRSDGMGIGLLRSYDLPMLVLSKEKNPIVAQRCKKLRLECIHGIDDKLPVLSSWLSERSIDPASVIYVGNDVNDLPCLDWVGCPAAPNDCHPSVLPSIRLHLSKPGGNGAVRELCDLIIGRLRSGKSAVASIEYSKAITKS